MRLTGVLGIASAVAIAAGAVAFVATRDSSQLRPPTIRLVEAAHGYEAHWTNPSHGVDYAPLTFDVEVFTKDGLIQNSFLQPDERHRAPGCCHIALRAGASGTTRLPRMRLPVGVIAFIDLHAGSRKTGYFPEIVCEFRSHDRITCRPRPED